MCCASSRLDCGLASSVDDFTIWFAAFDGNIWLCADLLSIGIPRDTNCSDSRKDVWGLHSCNSHHVSQSRLHHHLIHVVLQAFHIPVSYRLNTVIGPLFSVDFYLMKLFSVCI